MSATSLSRGVSEANFGKRKYNNFNYSILLYLVPALAYPDEVGRIEERHAHRSSGDYSIRIMLEYAALFERYLTAQIMPKMKQRIAPLCGIDRLLESKAPYAKGYATFHSSKGQLLKRPKYEFCRPQGGWYFSAAELAIFAMTLDHTNRLLDASTRAMLFDHRKADDRLLYNYTVSNTSFFGRIRQSRFAYHGGKQANYRAAMIKLPYGYMGVGLINSPHKESFEIAQEILDAFYAATHKDFKPRRPSRSDGGPFRSDAERIWSRRGASSIGSTSTISAPRPT